MNLLSNFINLVINPKRLNLISTVDIFDHLCQITTGEFFFLNKTILKLYLLNHNYKLVFSINN